MNNLLLHIPRILLHPLHPFLPTFLHLVSRIKNRLLLIPNNASLKLLHLIKNLIFSTLARNLFLKFLHLLLHFSVVAHCDMVLQIEVHLLLVFVH